MTALPVEDHQEVVPQDKDHQEVVPQGEDHQEVVHQDEDRPEMALPKARQLTHRPVNHRSTSLVRLVTRLGRTPSIL